MTMNLLSLYNLFIIIITILGIIITYLSFYLTGKTGNNFYIVWRSEAIQIGNDVSTHCQLHRLIKSWEHSWSAESGTTVYAALGSNKSAENEQSEQHTLNKQVQWLSPAVQTSTVTLHRIVLLKSFLGGFKHFGNQKKKVQESA